MTTEEPSDNKLPEEQILDLHPLMDMFDQDLSIVSEILHDFISPTDATIEEIVNAHHDKSLDKLEMASHKLKSSARSIGAYLLGDTCEQIEHASKHNDWTTIDELVPQLDSMMANIKSQIKEI
ncbi:MAG TPA: Hpt domain-containing protein [Bacteroidales bacterium]|nr:Hpt domain-containing protein [Bacteroidales bacterium]